MSTLHLAGVSDAPVPRKKRRHRSSKKKRLREKRRASLEPTKVNEAKNNKGIQKQIQETNSQREDNTLNHNKREEQNRIQQQNPEQKLEETIRQQDQIQARHQHKEQIHNNDEAKHQEQNEMTEYERKRRANILRNQEFMKQVGVSIAKLAARTTIGDEAANEAKRQRLEEKRAMRVAQPPPPPLAVRLRSQPLVKRATNTTGYVRRKVRLPVLKAIVDPVENNSVQSNGKDEQIGKEMMVSKHKRSEGTLWKVNATAVAPPLRTTMPDEPGKGGRLNVTKSIGLQTDYTCRAEISSPAVCTTGGPENDFNKQSRPLQRQPEVSPGENTRAEISDLCTEDENLDTKKDKFDQSEDRSHESGRDERSEMTNYESKRRQNILRNQAFMQQVGISAAKLAARTQVGHEEKEKARRKELAAKRSLQAAYKAERMDRPLRKSRRLGSEKVPVATHFVDLGHSLDILSVKGMRQPHGSKLYIMDATDEEGQLFCKQIAGGRGVGILKKNTTVNIDGDMDYSLAASDIVKALPYRVTTMAFLPRADRVVVACGDKEGHISLWSPSNDANRSAAALSRPHGYPVSQLIFPDESTVLSSSIDGTVREFDLHSAKSAPVCDISDETGVTSLIGSGNPQFYYASCEDGTLRLVDRRARKAHSASYALHQKRINSIDQHPRLDFCIATASNDDTVCLWDKRKISSEQNVPTARVQHTNSMHSAHFSPREGSWLVTVAHNSYINMHDTSNLIKCNIPGSIQFPHNTRTGTSTKLRPAWDPKRINRFVIGCLDQPSGLQFFRAGDPHPIHRLTNKSSAPSCGVVNVYHPHLDLIASGNLNGQVSLWRAKAT